MRLRRFGSWVQGLRARRVGAVLAIGALALMAAWATGWFGAAALSGLGLFMLGMLVSRPMAHLGSRLLRRSAPWRRVGSELEFGTARLGLEIAGLVGVEPPSTQTHRIIESGSRFELGDVFLEVWLVASDEDGREWTVAQEITEPQARWSTWTSSIDGWLTLADLDEAGRPNPFRSIHRLIEAEFGIAVAHIELRAWGREQTRSGDRSVVVAMAVAAAHAEKLEILEFSDSLADRRAHVVRLDPDGVAGILGGVHADQWRGGAVVGLLEALDRSHPGSWAAVEHRVSAQWREKAMFARVERGTEQVTGRALVVRP